MWLLVLNVLTMFCKKKRTYSVTANAEGTTTVQSLTGDWKAPSSTALTRPATRSYVCDSFFTFNILKRDGAQDCTSFAAGGVLNETDISVIATCGIASSPTAQHAGNRVLIAQIGLVGNAPVLRGTINAAIGRPNEVVPPASPEDIQSICLGSGCRDSTSVVTGTTTSTSTTTSTTTTTTTPTSTTPATPSTTTTSTTNTLPTSTTTTVGTSTTTAGSTTTAPEGTATPSAVQTTDLSVIKDDCHTAIFPGSSSVFSLTVLNLGPSVAQNVVLSDTFPSLYTVTNVTGPCELVSGSSKTFRCTWASVAPGTNVSALFSYTVAISAQTGLYVTNCASVTSATTDITTSNNEDCDTNTIALCSGYNGPCASSSDCCSPLTCLRHVSTCNTTSGSSYRCALRGGGGSLQ